MKDLLVLIPTIMENVMNMIKLLNTEMMSGNFANNESLLANVGQV